MIDKINKLMIEISSISVKTMEDLEFFRLKYLSKKGVISDLFEEFRSVPVPEKKETGQSLNLLKQTALDKYNTFKSKIYSSADTSLLIDLTMPSYPFDLGSRHPISIVRNEIINIFTDQRYDNIMFQ